MHRARCAWCVPKMALEEVNPKELVRQVYNASHDVFEALRVLVLRTEELQEKLLREKFPEVKLSEAELKSIDAGLKEMREGSTISLEEFNKKHHPEVYGESEKKSR
jgi:hypothetical protein